MDKALIAHHPGGPEVMLWQDIATPTPGTGEVLLRQTAIGVNFLDIYNRSGLYPWTTPTMIPGAEAAGVVEAVGPGVVGFAPGDRVAYVLPHGAYRQRRVVPAERLLPLPQAISDVQIAGALLKGLTAQYLVTACHAVQPGDRVLVHAAAGGVGLLLGQWLKALGAVAIGTAGSAEKVALARQHGYDHVINYRTEDFVAAVRDLTHGEGVAVVYDSVGQDTWAGSLKCLQRRGMFVNFGQSSGMITGFTLADLARGGSLSANRPVLFDYIASRTELLTRSGDLFARMASGALQTQAPHCRPLHEAAIAHDDLENRRTTGATVLLP
jgi:NADPH2:quinone reductase